MHSNGAMTGPTSSSSAWLRGVVHLFASQGVEPEWLFAQAGLDAARLKDRHARFLPDEVNRLWTLAVAGCGQPALGLDRPLARRFINFEIAAQAMWPGSALGSGLDSFSRYLLLIGDLAAFTVRPARPDRWLELTHGIDDGSPRQRVEFSMLALLLLCQRVTHRPVRPLAAEFVFPEPADFHAHRMAFKCPIRFGQPANRMRLAEEDLGLPIVSAAVTANDSIFALQDRVVEARFARLPHARTSYRAGEEIIRRLHLGAADRLEVARSLGLGEAALEQRLRAEGTAFDTLVDDVRKDLAAQYLSQPGYGLARIARLLGWQAAAQLAAACRRWWGVLPGEYRQARAVDGAAP